MRCIPRVIINKGCYKADNAYQNEPSDRRERDLVLKCSNATMLIERHDGFDFAEGMGREWRILRQEQGAIATRGWAVVDIKRVP